MAPLITSIDADNLNDLQNRAAQAWKGGSDGIELRLDTYCDDPAQLADYIRKQRDRIWILTCRGVREGGRSRGTPAERGALLADALRGTSAYVDFEHRDWHDSGRLSMALSAVEGQGGEARSRLILSAHDYDEAPQRLEELVQEMLATEEAAVAKIAYRGDGICDSFPALDIMHRHGRRVTAICMGEAGLWSRILAAKLDAFCSYCSVATCLATAPGQLTLGEMKEQYRWAEIDPATRIYGVIGDPVSHSMSPRLFNYWFATHEINAVYLPLLVGKEHSGLERFLDGCAARPWLDLSGVSVTVPHKTAALRWVGSGADWLGQSIGAANTLVFSDRTCRSYNTDCYAALTSLLEALGGNTDKLAGLTVDVLGCGGAAHALVAGLRLHGSDITIYARSPEKARTLAQRFDCKAKAWKDRTKRSGAVLVNATSIGMWPAVDNSPMPTEALDGCRLVFDLVYNPLVTRLLKQANAVGASTLSGLDMFVRQAAMQFELWTSIRPDRNQGRRLIQRHLARSEKSHP